MNAPNSVKAWTNRLAERPEIFPHQLNLINDSLLLVELAPDEVKAAGFLDQRVLKQTTKGQWVPWPAVADVFKETARGELPGFIFHVGHCGSTLLSRLIEFAEETQCLREPLPLRTLAQDIADAGDGRSFLTPDVQQARLQVLLNMWCRGARHTVIKATSICTDLLPEIQSLEPGVKSIFMYNRPETHITTLLAGQNSLIDLKGFAQLRLQRLQQKSGLDIQLNRLGTGQLAALSWLSETTSICRHLDQCPEHVALLEFESLLNNPTENLARLLKHLDIPASRESVGNAVLSPVLQTYSKAPEHKYNAQTRAAILDDARSRFRQEIREGLAWLENLASRSERVDIALKKFG